MYSTLAKSLLQPKNIVRTKKLYFWKVKIWKLQSTLLAIMGPGLIVMIGDNDAGGVATYAQAGQNDGTSLLWVLLLLIPVLIVNQEMVVRLG